MAYGPGRGRLVMLAVGPGTPGAGPPTLHPHTHPLHFSLPTASLLGQETFLRTKPQNFPGQELGLAG